MITPLALRQMFQTVAAESVRAAHEGNEQSQREVARRLLFDHRMAEDQSAVHLVAESQGLKLEERQGGRGGSPRQPKERQEAGNEDSVDEAPADSAEKHLDLLA
ncbi:MAG: hypothetical protein HY823_01595 [Acidobacteria bacterium]|nr:hypothetical protein [Acidobacteriota bacterium]